MTWEIPTAQAVLPIIATLLFAAAIVLPLRDDRRGRRATIRGKKISIEPNFERLSAGHDPANDFATAVTAATDADAPINPPADGTEPTPSPTQAAPLRPIIGHLKSLLARMQRQSAAQVAQPPGSAEAEPHISSDEEMHVFAPHDAFASPAQADTLAYGPFAHEGDLPIVKAVPSPGHPDDATGQSPSSSPSELHLSESRETLPDASDAAVGWSRFPWGSDPPVSETDDDVKLDGEPATPSRGSTIHAVSARATDSVCARAVPLTRLPLRPSVTDITWPALLNPPAHGLSREARHAALQAVIDGNGGNAVHTLLAAAYREEDHSGRLLVLRALRGLPSDKAADIYRSALLGGDEERSLAIDGLAASGNRSVLATALNDRSDALAAKAAFLFAETRDKDTFVRLLRDHLEDTRIESLTALLAGVLE